MARRPVIDRLVVSLLAVVGGTATADRVLADDHPPDPAPGEGHPEEVEQGGTVNLFRGSDASVTTAGAQLWHRGAYGIDGPPEEHANLGVLGS